MLLPLSRACATPSGIWHLLVVISSGTPRGRRGARDQHRCASPLAPFTDFLRNSRFKAYLQAHKWPSHFLLH
jgi:hypothetical protein